MSHRHDRPMVFWSEADWQAEIAELDAKVAGAKGTDAERFWWDRAKEARRAFEAAKG